MAWLPALMAPTIRESDRASFAAASDVDAWAAHLEGHGVALKARPKTHRDGSRSLYFEAPSGLVVQIIHHTPMI